MEHLYIADLICMELIYGTRLAYYRMATISRLLQISGLFFQNMVSFIELFCKRDL